jgi:hypothetical protein
METYTEWCRQHFNLIADGGTWIVPRSGLKFTKQGNQLVLTERAPYNGDQPHIAETWKQYQWKDYELIRFEFFKAGISVTDTEDWP